MVGADRHRGNLSTVGIVVSDWTYYKKVQESQTSLRSITFMTWDFGGQEEYYATHQCFISRRSLYLAVWNVTHGQAGAEELKPWLLNIQVYSGGLHVHTTYVYVQIKSSSTCLYIHLHVHVGIIHHSLLNKMDSPNNPMSSLLVIASAQY